jgi:hypothetical protein
MRVQYEMDNFAVIMLDLRKREELIEMKNKQSQKDEELRTTSYDGVE